MPPGADPEQLLLLNCVIFGEAHDNGFVMEVAPGANVAYLAGLIQAKNISLAVFPVRGLKLFNVSLPFEKMDINNFKQEIELAVGKTQSLSSFRLLGNVYNSGVSAGDLHIVVQSPIDAQSTIGSKLRDHGPLFDLLHVRVSEFGSWSDDDVLHNMNEGKILVPGHSQLPVELVQMEEKLVQTRTYARPPVLDQWPGFRAASHPVHTQLFGEVYEEQDGPSVSVKDDREFLAFSDILERHQEDLSNLSSDKGSSSMKASHFAVRFIVPPFFCTFEKFKYKEQRSLGFPIFLTERSPRESCKFIPRPDFMVTSTSSNCPFVTSEVVSDLKESDKRRMQLQAIAFARAGQHLMKTGEQFFAVAIYLCANMTAERYVVAQVGEENKVFMCQKNFNLCRPNDSVSFLREMYNLATELEELEGKFDPGKTNSLVAINNTTGRLPSLTEIQKYRKASALVRGGLDPIVEGGGTADDPGVFDADDIQAILEEMGYKIKFIPVGYPRVAVVSSVTDNSKTGFLKFVPDGGDEIEILMYLSTIDSPRNHTITGVRFWTVHGGQVISMPAAGNWVTHLRSPDAQLWSVAAQLVEAVDFMHQHGVAHLDLKPANILIPLGGGRLSIIDFNASERVEGVETTLGGVVGTRGYISPEAAAGRGVFSAVRAGLWSCGKTLSELCDLCRPSADRGVLLQIAQALMDDDPKNRPTTPDVLKWMASYEVDGDVNWC